VVENDRHGCPIVHVAGAREATGGLRVSIAHKPNVAVAAAATLTMPPPGADRADTACSGIGVDIEAVEPRSGTFERTVLSTAERSLRPDTDEDRDTWLTRLWTVKEAAAKATGLGLRGRPKDFEIDGVAGPAFRCRRGWIMTEPLVTANARFVVAWTETARRC
jgi:phosphopantetheinyl transferase